MRSGRVLWPRAMHCREAACDGAGVLGKGAPDGSSRMPGQRVSRDSPREEIHPDRARHSAYDS